MVWGDGKMCLPKPEQTGYQVTLDREKLQEVGGNLKYLNVRIVPTLSVLRKGISRLYYVNDG